MLLGITKSLLDSHVPIYLSFLNVGYNKDACCFNILCFFTEFDLLYIKGATFTWIAMFPCMCRF